MKPLFIRCIRTHFSRLTKSVSHFVVTVTKFVLQTLRKQQSSSTLLALTFSIKDFSFFDTLLNTLVSMTTCFGHSENKDGVGRARFCRWRETGA